MVRDGDPLAHFRPMRVPRPSSVALVLIAVVTVALAPAPAGAAEPGVGTSGGGTQLLHLRIGDGSLDLGVGTELSDTSNDPSAPTARERVIPLLVSSSLLPALDALSTPAIEVVTSGDERSTSTPGIDLGSLTAGAPVPGVLDGTVEPATLRAVVDATGALADATSGVSDLAVLGGVLRVGDLSALLGSAALGDVAEAGRSLQLDRVEVLDLDAVLQLLGLELTDLPLDIAAGLLQRLGVPLPGGAATVDQLVATVEGALAQAGNVPAQVAALGDQLVAAQGQVASLTNQLAAANTLVGTACALLGGLPIDPTGCAAAQATVTSLQGQITTVNAQIASLTAQIAALLDSVAALLRPVLDIIGGLVAGLQGTPLLSIENLQVGVASEAAATVEASSAEVIASVGAVRVGTVTIPGADALALASAANIAIGSVLSVIDPALGGLVDVDLLTQSTSVTSDGPTTLASAVLTGVRATVTPPDLCGLLTRLGARTVTDTVEDVLASVGQRAPLPQPVGDVLADLGSILSCSTSTGAQRAGGQLVGGVVAALVQPLTLEVLTVTAQSRFTPAGTQVPAAPGPGAPALPRTGGEVPLALAGFATLSALALRRVLVKAR